MSRRPRAVLVTTLAGLIAVAGGASAAPLPAVGTVKTVSATLQIGGTDGRTYVLTVTGQQRDLAGQTTSSEVSLGWRSCLRDRRGKTTCSTPTAYRIQTTTGEFSVAADGSTARLLLRVSDTPLDLTWERIDSSHSLNFSVDTDGVAASDPTSSGPATAHGKVFAVTCRGNATVQTNYVLRTAAPTALPGSTQPPRVPAALTKARHCLTP